MLIIKILYVLHSGTTGGTFLTNKDLMMNIVNDFEIFLLSAENDFLQLFTFKNKKLSLIKKYSRFHKWSSTNFHDSWLTYVYFDILINFNIDIIHIRHFINHSFDLPEVANKLNIPVIASIHDFYLICPFYTLLDEDCNFCEGKCNDNEKNCYCSLDSLKDINSKKIINIWRFNVSIMINFVDCFITTSFFVKDLFLSIYPQMNNSSFEVIEHGRDFPSINDKFYEIPTKNNPIKILCVANYLNVMKGSNFIKKIKEFDVDNKIEFHFLGNCRDGVEKYGINHGTFERDEFYKKVKEIKPSFIGVFSIWPETFCHTLTEAWSCQIPVFGSNIGVIKDRVLKTGGGWIIDINDIEKSYNKIMDVSKDIDEYMGVVDNIKNIKLKTTNEMAKEYMGIYSKYLKHCRNQF